MSSKAAISELGPSSRSASLNVELRILIFVSNGSIFSAVMAAKLMGILGATCCCVENRGRGGKPGGDDGLLVAEVGEDVDLLGAGDVLLLDGVPRAGDGGPEEVGEL